MRGWFFLFLVVLTIGFTHRAANAVTRIDLVNFSQIHTAVNQMSSVDPSPFPEYTLVWTPSLFPTRFRAQLMRDVLVLSTAWNGWINEQGLFIRGFRAKTRVVISDEPFEPLAESVRSADLFQWLGEQVQKNPSLVAHTDDFLRLTPREMGFAREAITNALLTVRVSPSHRANIESQIEELTRKAMRPKPQLVAVSRTASRSCESLFSPHAALRGI